MRDRAARVHILDAGRTGLAGAGGQGDGAVRQHPSGGVTGRGTSYQRPASFREGGGRPMFRCCLARAPAASFEGREPMGESWGPSVVVQR